MACRAEALPAMNTAGERGVQWGSGGPLLVRPYCMVAMCAGIGKSNGLFHRPRPPTPCHSAPAGARAWRRPAPLAPPTLASTPPGRARGAPRRKARTGRVAEDGWPAQLEGGQVHHLTPLLFPIRKSKLWVVRHERSGSFALAVDPSARDAGGKHVVLVMLAHLHRFMQREIVDRFVGLVGYKIISRRNVQVGQYGRRRN